MITVTRYHDISCGHRVVGHEGKCRNLHGHNYRFYFTIASDKGLDDVGRVLDFSVIKERLCMWLEEVLDHKMIMWSEDPMLPEVKKIDPTVVEVPFNPTAENLAKYMVEVSAHLLKGTGTKLIKVTIEETRKCSATYETT